ncbi:DNA-binding protein H-NS [Gammaproteobacteria bacterium]
MFTKEEIVAVMNSMSTTELSQIGNDALRIVNSRRSEALKTVTQIIGEYGFTAADLGFEAGVHAPEPKKSDGVRALYRHPTIPTETWAGRGRKPGWLLDLLAEGWTLDKLRIANEEGPIASPALTDEELQQNDDSPT